MGLPESDGTPPIETVMTPLPYTVEEDDRIDEAERVLSEHDIRHLPVTRNGALVGLLSDRDLKLLVNPALTSPERHRIRVGQICARNPYAIEMGTPLDRVLREMARRHLDSALVTQGGKLAGIFTSTDACRLLAEALQVRAEPIA